MINDELVKKADEKFSTPFYLYDKAEIVAHVEKLKSTIFESAQLFYSMKANPEKLIIKCLLEQGCGVEVASLGEMKLAIEAGCNPVNIIFTGPGKEIDELEKAIEIGIYCINIENILEIDIISSIAARLQKDVNIGIRINPQNGTTGKISMNGVTQFGIGTAQVGEAIEHARKSDYVHLIGFQIYAGTQILNSDVISENVEQMIDIVFEMVDKYNLSIKYLNFGGGFGVPYFFNDKELDMKILHTNLQTIYEKCPKLAEVNRIVFESGRYIVAEAGVFVVKILYEKVVRGSKFLICDGGSNFHSAAAFLGRFVRNNFPMHSISDKTEEEKVTIVGNLCTPSDVIGQNVTIKKAVVGDLIVVEKSGAYGLSFSPSGFLRHRLPVEIMYDNGMFLELGKGDKV